MNAADAKAGKLYACRSGKVVEVQAIYEGVGGKPWGVAVVFVPHGTRMTLPPRFPLEPYETAALKEGLDFDVRAWLRRKGTFEERRAG